MSLSPLIPLATGLAPLAEKAIEAVGDGLSFLQELGASANDAAPTIDDAANLRALDQIVDKLASRLREEFAAAGLATTTARLKSDGRDGVIVDGDHPERVRIEAIFASDTTLRELFHELAASASGDSNVDNFRLVVDRDELHLEVGGRPTRSSSSLRRVV